MQEQKTLKRHWCVTPADD